ncbi:SctU family type III secretion system export apparatus subunit BscU [Variovorax defluvii]|uniref:SctU family type III secretion system export apparatus subunit BscU n=1 Tax=Variovorax defluvii TaxID=913761 RepID=A0ABP8HZY4_9BURK
MSEKTEQPTSHRIRQAREDGQIAKSKDFTEVVMMGALVGYTLAAGGDIFRELAAMIVQAGELAGHDFSSALAVATTSMLRAGTAVLLPYILIVVVVGFLVEGAQTGMLVSFKALMPKADKLDPIANLKQMFSMKSLVEFLKTNLKVLILSFIVYFVVRDSLQIMVKLPLTSIGESGRLLGEMMWVLFKCTFIAFLAIAVLDLVWQRYSYIKSLMMSIDEIKQEHKQMEGDPHVKGHRKELAKEIAMGEAVGHTKDASVLVTNPTHLAVALYYQAGETPLPVVVAKGEGVVAEAMKRAAEEAGVPVMQNVPLARGLMRHAAVYQYIPSEFIEPVAQVLLAVRRLKEELAWEAQELRHDF